MHAEPRPTLERLLQSAYDAPVPASVDARVWAAIRARPVVRSGAAPAARRGLRWTRAVATLAAGLLVLAAASPLARFFDGWDPEFDHLYAVSMPIGESVTIDGYRVTVDRAYADTSDLRLAIVAEDTLGRDVRELRFDDPTVVDEAGATYPPLMGTFAQPHDRATATWMRFRVPDDASRAGTRTLRVVVPSLRVLGARDDPTSTWDRIEGPWVFEFDLRFIDVRTARPAVVATAAGVTATFEELAVSPATVTARLSFVGLADRPASWAWDPYLCVQHDGVQLDLVMLSPGSVLETLTFEAVPGSDTVAGRWAIIIEKFHRDIPDPSSDVTTETEEVVGPWILVFEGPAVEGSSSPGSVTAAPDPKGCRPGGTPEPS